MGLSITALTQYEAYTFLHRDGAFYADINKSLWRDGGLDQGRYHPRSWLEESMGWNRHIDQGWSNVSLGADGETWYPKHSWVMPLFSTPFYALFGNNGLLAFHLLMLGLFLVASFAVASKVVPAGPAAVAVLLVAAQPVVTAEVYAYNNDAFYSGLCLLAVWAFAAGRWTVAGLLFGIACWAKLTNVLFVLPFAAVVLWTRDWARLGRAVAAFAAPLLVFAISNAVMFGSPTTTSYDTILVRDNGVMKTESISARFEEPFGDGMVRVFRDGYEGLDRKAPLLWLAVLGMILGASKPATRWWSVGFGVSYLLFLGLHAKYHYTYSRFFLPVVGLSVLPVGVALHAAGRFVRWPTVTAGLGGVAVLAAMFSGLGSDDAWRATAHIEDAVVTHARKESCDYFNNMRQKFECFVDGTLGHEYFWGRAMGKQCTFDGQPKPMLWLHPPPRGRRRAIRFSNVPPGTLEVEYGLAETSRFDNVKLIVAVNGEALELRPIRVRGELLRHEATLEGDANTLEITVRTPPSEWRHLCVEATVR